MTVSSGEKFKAIENKFSIIDLPMMGMTKDKDGKVFRGFYPLLLADAIGSDDIAKILLADFFGSTVVLPIMVESENGEFDVLGTVRQVIMEHFWTVYQEEFGSSFHDLFFENKLIFNDIIEEKIGVVVDNAIKELSYRVKPAFDLDLNEWHDKVSEKGDKDGKPLIYHATTLASLIFLGQKGASLLDGKVFVLEAFLSHGKNAVTVDDLMSSAKK